MELTRESTVEQYVRLAQVNTPGEVWEIAKRTGLAPADLGRLAARLRSMEPPKVRVRGYWTQGPRFKLRPKERRELAVSLLEAGVEDRQIRKWTGMSRTVLWRLHHEREQNGGLTTTSEPSVHAGLSVSKPPNRTYLSNPPMFHFDATSGNSDTGPVASVGEEA